MHHVSNRALPLDRVHGERRDRVFCRKLDCPGHVHAGVGVLREGSGSSRSGGGRGGGGGGVREGLPFPRARGGGGGFLCAREKEPPQRDGSKQNNFWCAG